MEALSKALIAARYPSTGHVAQIKLTTSAHQGPTYLRGFPVRMAVYDETAIQWS
jgi:hypothetical protein